MINLFKKDKQKEIRISLSLEDFITLVQGKVVTQDNVKIILQDIGYINMINILKKELEKIF